MPPSPSQTGENREKSPDFAGFPARRADCPLIAVPTAKSQSLSILIHLSVLTALLIMSSRGLMRTLPPLPLESRPRLVFIPPRAISPAAAPRSGGANRADAPARRGNPPQAARRAFVPPTVHRDPKLPMPLSLDFDAPTVLLTADLGDPYSKAAGLSLGTDGAAGIGNSGCCGGVGDRSGPGRGLDSGGAGHPITPARLIYKVEPEFSEEARKAKFQGMVVLSVEIGVNGRAARMTVVSSPGLGLDQRALDAVAQWRFRPAMRDGKAILTTARVEVSFHLL